MVKEEKLHTFVQINIDYTIFLLKQMIANRFFTFVALLLLVFLFSSCLDSKNENVVEYDYTKDAQIFSISLSSKEDTLNVLPKVKFSINQVASAPIIFNRDSLPYLFKVSNVKLSVSTRGASGIKLHLINPDSVYIWDVNDSVMINRLKHLEVYAADGITKRLYTFKLNTHQQDPDIISWENVAKDYIDSPTEQITVADAKNFYTFYKINGSIKLSSSSMDDGKSWTKKAVTGLPEKVDLKSMFIDASEESLDMWYVKDGEGKVYASKDGVSWAIRPTDLPITAIFGKMPSFDNSFVLLVVKDGEEYKFAKTMDFSSLEVLNKIPEGFPMEDFTYTTFTNPAVYTAKYLIAAGGLTLQGDANKKVWVLQEGENKITAINREVDFDVTGSSLFNYDGKIYILASKNNENVFYTSSNYGLFWTKVDSKQALPTDYLFRTNQSVNVDNKNTIWIFGGVSSERTQLVDIWKGRINKLLIK